MPINKRTEFRISSRLKKEAIKLESNWDTNAVDQNWLKGASLMSPELLLLELWSATPSLKASPGKGSGNPLP